MTVSASPNRARAHRRTAPEAAPGSDLGYDWLIAEPPC